MVMRVSVLNRAAEARNLCENARCGSHVEPRTTPRTWFASASLLRARLMSHTPAAFGRQADGGDAPSGGQLLRARISSALGISDCRLPMRVAPLGCVDMNSGGF